MSDGKTPMQRAQELSRPRLPKRFYKTVAVAQIDGGFAVTLDDRPLKTPGRKPLTITDEAVCRLIADEWEAQRDEIDPATMPVTRLANTAIDGVDAVRTEVARDIATYACSDMVCYRAETPEGLVAQQAASWDPLIAWFETAYGMALKRISGIMPISQDQDAARAIGERLSSLDGLELAALHTLTTLSGSAVIALAVHARHIDAADAWAAAHVDEDWQISQWGEDAEALARRAARWREFEAASRVLDALQTHDLS